jgi:hypothetical protein
VITNRRPDTGTGACYVGPSDGSGSSGGTLWVLAGAILLTTDKDFDPLDGHLITRIWFDPQVPAATGA